MRTIELSIKKRMKRMNLTALLLGGVCLLCQPLQAQQSIDACDGRTYKVSRVPLCSGRMRTTLALTTSPSKNFNTLTRLLPSWT